MTVGASDVGLRAQRSTVAASGPRTLPRDAGRWAAGVREVAPILAIGVVITFLAWPFPDGPAKIGLDPSWQVALHLATWMDLRQGVELVFTYGPLGFLSVPHPYLGPTSLLALFACGAVYLGLIVVLLVEARRVVPLWAAALVVLAVARTFRELPPFEALEVMIFIGSAEALAGRFPARDTALAAAIGVAAGCAALGKLNVAVVVAAMGVVTATSLDRRWWRGLGVFVVAACSTGLFLWVATGQRLGDLGAFVANALEIVGGYSAALGTEREPGRLWIYPAFVAVAILFGVISLRISAELPRRRRVGLLTICLVLIFAMWKTAFTREFPTFAFASFLVCVVALGPAVQDRREWAASLLTVGVVLVVASSVPLVSYLDFVASARSLASEATTAVIPGRAHRAEERNRAALRAQYRLDAATIAQLSGQRVSIDPTEAAVAFAYPEVVWAPLPVFQSYAAYTPALDRLNADRLRSADAPARILRTIAFNAHPPNWLIRQRGQALSPGESIPVVVDGRFRWFESPQAMLETFCRYRQLSATDRWQVLGPTGGSCGPAEPFGTVQASEGATVPVPTEPRPDRFIVVRVLGLEPSPAERLRTALFKTDEWYVTIADIRYRLVAPTASSGLLLAVPLAADGTGVFAFGPPIRSLSIESNRAGGVRPLTYEFESVPLLQP